MSNRSWFYYTTKPASSIHPSIHPSIRSFVRSFLRQSVSLYVCLSITHSLTHSVARFKHRDRHATKANIIIHSESEVSDSTRLDSPCVGIASSDENDRFPVGGFSKIEWQPPLEGAACSPSPNRGRDPAARRSCLRVWCSLFYMRFSPVVVPISLSSLNEPLEAVGGSLRRQ